MFDQLFELSRKAVESSVQAQQAVAKHMMQEWLISTPGGPPGISTDWGGAMRKRFVDLTLDTLQKHRESVDSTYRAALHAVEHAFRVSESKSYEDSIRAMGDAYRSWFESFKGHSDARFQEYQSWVGRLFDMTRNDAKA